jgi:voltage-gated potassium channel
VIVLLLRLFGQNHRKHIAILLVTAAACLLGGAEAFAVTQGRPFTTGVYWAITTATTVGYGDITPKDPTGRLIASLVMLTTIPMLASVFALATGDAAAAGLRRILDMRSKFPEGSYRLVVGMSDMVPAILTELAEAGVKVVLVADVDEEGVPGEVHLVRGDPTDEAVIKAANPAGAEQALITGKTDGDVLVSSVMVRKLAPDLNVAAVVSSASVREALADLGVHQTISAHALVASALAKSLETPHAADMLGQLVESNAHRLTEIAAGPDTIGKPLSAVRDERSGLVLGLVHGGKFSLGLADDPVIQAGDYLLIAEGAMAEVVSDQARPVPARSTLEA